MVPGAVAGRAALACAQACHAVPRVKRERQEDQEPLHESQERDPPEAFHRRDERALPRERGRVGAKMQNEKHPQRHDAAERVQAPEEERAAGRGGGHDVLGYHAAARERHWGNVGVASGRGPGHDADVRLLGAFVVSSACVACGAGGPPPATPAVGVGSTREAQAAFAEAQASLGDATSGRDLVRLRLERFLDKYPGDGLVPLARAYLAHVALDLGDGATADRQIRLVTDAVAQAGGQPGALGTAGDLAVVARGRRLRQLGQHDAAYRLMLPLVGKLIDPWARAILSEQTAIAAIDAGYEYEAFAYMDNWLREAQDEERPAVRARVLEQLARTSRPALEATLRAMGAGHDYGRELRRLVAERLARIAIEGNDVDLAKRLLDVESAAGLVGADATLALQRVASAKRGVIALSGRSIGLVLPTHRAALRDAAADVTRGAAYALGLPRTDPSRDDGVRLVTRNESGGTAALDELAGEGAAAIIAGFDPGSAQTALEWSERSGVAVLLLATPESAPGLHSFVLGQSEASELDALDRELRARKITRSSLVLGSPELTGVALGHALFTPPRTCAAGGADVGARTVTVAGPEGCGRSVGAAMRSTGVTTLALSLEAVWGSARTDGSLAVLALSAGRFPSRTDSAEVQAYVQRFGGRPTWWAALGRDAAALAHNAVRTLPTGETHVLGEVARRREAVRVMIELERTDLWSSDARGFGPDHVLARALRLVEL